MKIDFEKVKEHAQSAAEGAADFLKERAEDVADKAMDIRDNLQLRLLRPVFIDDTEESLTDVIRIVDHDETHEKAEVCKGSIGFIDDVRGMNIINLYTKYADKYGITFYPFPDEGLYHVDPYDKNTYIGIDDYYLYLKQARQSELTQIAQDLGAKYIKISYVEEAKRITSRKKKVDAKANAAKVGVVKGTLEQNEEEKTFDYSQILYDSTFPGGKPKEPQLRYFKNDSQINQLVEARLHEDNPLGHQVLSIEQKNKAGIAIVDACKIDFALKKYKLIDAKVNATFRSATEQENRTSFKYEVDF